MRAFLLFRFSLIVGLIMMGTRLSGAGGSIYQRYQTILTLENDSLKCHLLLNYADTLRSQYHDYNFALMVYEKVGSILKGKNLQSLDINLYRGWALAYYEKGNYEEADKIYTKMLSLKLLNTKPAYKAHILNMAAMNIQRLMVNKRALVYYSEALEIYTQLKDARGKAVVYWNMADVFATTGSYTQADSLFNKALSLFGKNGLNEHSAIILASKAFLKRKIGQTDSAKILLIRSLSMHLKGLKDPAGYAERCANLGVVYADIKKWDSCFYYLNRAKQLSDSIGTADRFDGSYYNFMGYSYDLKGEPKKALSYYKHALKIKSGIPNYRYIYENIADIYIKQRQFDSAFLYKDRAITLADSIYKSELKEYVTFENKRRELLEKDYEYQIESSQQQHSLQQLEKRNYFFIGIILVLTIVVLLFFVYFRQYRYKVKREHLQSELAFLRAQLNPHFLFNSINNIYVLLDQNKEKALEILLKFSDLMRYQLYECNVAAILLGKELRFLENYIEFEKLRYSNKITVYANFHIASPENLLIAPLLLQPFIENAFKHTPKNKGQQNRIDIQISVQDRELVMEVSNTLAATEASALPGGIGLANVKKRLKLLYSNRYELHISAVDELYKVVLRLKLGE